MSQPANSDDADPGRGGDPRDMQGIEHGRSPTHQGRRVLIADALGDLEQERLAPHGMRGKRTLVEVRATVHLTFRTHSFPAREAFGASTAASGLIAPAYTIAFLQVLDFRTDFVDHPGTFVAQGHVGVLIVDIRETDARVSESDEDFVAFEVIAVGGAFGDGSVFGPFEDGEIVSHDDFEPIDYITRLEMEIICVVKAVWPVSKVLKMGFYILEDILG